MPSDSGLCHHSQYFWLLVCLLWQEFYTDNPKTCPDYGRIINQRHFKRIMAMLEDSTVAVGGDNDESDCYIGNTSYTNQLFTWSWVCHPVVSKAKKNLHFNSFQSGNDSSLHRTNYKNMLVINSVSVCVVFSPHSSAGCEARGKGDAGGDIWTSAPHPVGQRPGRGDQVYQ